MDFIDALNIATGVFDQYKIDQLKWWKKMDGTPILNDVAVRMAMEFVHAWNDEESARSAFEMQHVLKNGDLYDSEPVRVSQPVAWLFPDIGMTTTSVKERDRWLAEKRDVTDLYLASPNYEALKDENESLKLRVAELQSECEKLRNRPFDCWSNDDGDSWGEHPADGEFVDGLKVGDTFELLAGYDSVRVNYIVTKAPDDINDDYEVEQAK